MIDLALDNVYVLGAALVIGVATARWAFGRKKAAAAETKRKEEEEARP